MYKLKESKLLRATRECKGFIISNDVDVDCRKLFFFFFNIHTSDKLEIFFGGRVFSDSQPRSQDAILFTMAKALCTGQRHYNRIHYNYHI